MTHPSRTLVLLGLLLLLPACAGDGTRGSATPSRTPAPSPTASATPTPGPVPPEVAAEAAGVVVPDVAEGATAELRRNEGVDVYRLAFTLPDQASLDAFCTGNELNGSFPEPGPVTAEQAARFGVPAGAAGARTCDGSLPGDYAVQRDVLASAADGGRVSVVLLSSRAPR